MHAWSIRGIGKMTANAAFESSAYLRVQRATCSV